MGTLLLLAIALGACLSASPEDEASTASTSSAVRNGEGDPEDPPPKKPKPNAVSCDPVRFDLFRSSQPCASPTAAPKGAWTMKLLFPDAPNGVRERMCSYVWRADGNDGSCASPRTEAIARDVDSGADSFVPRGDCSANQGCTRTSAVNASVGKTAVDPGGPAADTVSDAPDGGSAPAAAKAVGQTTAGDGGTTTGSGDSTSPNGPAGCCDACRAYVEGNWAYLVLPYDSGGRSPEFYVTNASTSARELVRVTGPITGVMQVMLDSKASDGLTSYVPGTYSHIAWK